MIWNDEWIKGRNKTVVILKLPSWLCGAHGLLRFRCENHLAGLEQECFGLPSYISPQSILMSHLKYPVVSHLQKLNLCLKQRSLVWRQCRLPPDMKSTHIHVMGVRHDTDWRNVYMICMTHDIWTSEEKKKMPLLSDHNSSHPSLHSVWLQRRISNSTAGDFSHISYCNRRNTAAQL